MTQLKPAGRRVEINIFKVLILVLNKMGKKDKGADKPDASADLENLKADILDLESTEISILTKSIYSIYNFIIKGI